MHTYNYLSEIKHNSLFIVALDSKNIISLL